MNRNKAAEAVLDEKIKWSQPILVGNIIKGTFFPPAHNKVFITQLEGS